MTPAREGTVTRQGVDLHWEEYGAGPSTIYLTAPWLIVHSQAWKLIVACLADEFRIIVSDPPGNGRSGPSDDPARHSPQALSDDMMAVLDAAGVDRAVLVAHSRGAQPLLLAAAQHPDRVAGSVFLAPLLPYTRSLFPRLLTHPWLRPAFELPGLPRGYGRLNARFISGHREEFDEWFMRWVASKPHSERGVDDAMRWAAGADTASLVASLRAPLLRDRATLDRLAHSVENPVLVVHGTRDKVIPLADGRWLAEATGGRLLTLDGCDHAPHGRYAVPTSLAIRDFADEVLPRPVLPVDPTATPRSDRRPGRRRVLMVSSPIGLGHARRDVAIVKALRELRDDVDVEWLAQDPVTRVLADEGETIHPASSRLHSECRHFELESAGHELDVFNAFLRADSLVTHNFMVFRDLTASEHFDAVIGDEAWEIDHYLHEHPEEKRAPYIWLTDFAGVLPMPDADERERRLVTDANALLIEQLETRPDVRDLSLFIGNAADALPLPLGDGLPSVRDFAGRHFRFTGYVGARTYDDEVRHRARQRLGIPVDEPLCVIAVGGSGVGNALLERAAEAHRIARQRIPELRTVLVNGPRISAQGPEIAGLDRRGYVPDLDKVMAGADIAVVQGGLATSMELAANATPFVYVPLERHFEQHFHVHHRLRNYGAGTRVDYVDADPDHLAALIQSLSRGPVEVRPVEQDGHLVAARHIADLIG